MNGCGIPPGTKVKIIRGEYRDMRGVVLYSPSKKVLLSVLGYEVFAMRSSVEVAK